QKNNYREKSSLMDYKLVLQHEAILDMQEAFTWYEEQKPGLGYSFLEEVEACYQKLCKNPEYYGMLNQFLRRIKVNGFPYLVIYEIDNDEVITSSVWHTSKSPKH